MATTSTHRSRVVEMAIKAGEHVRYAYKTGVGVRGRSESRPTMTSYFGPRESPLALPEAPLALPRGSTRLLTRPRLEHSVTLPGGSRNAGLPLP
jgi:hypothetical protein